MMKVINVFLCLKSKKKLPVPSYNRTAGTAFGREGVGLSVCGPSA